MKKLCFVALLATLGFTQQSIAQDIEFGAKAGLNISNFTGGDADRNSLVGFHVGFISEIPLSEKFSLQPELLYSTQGSEAQDVVKIKVDYLAIPVMAKYYLTETCDLEIYQFCRLADRSLGSYVWSRWRPFRLRIGLVSFDCAFSVLWSALTRESRFDFLA